MKEPEKKRGGWKRESIQAVFDSLAACSAATKIPIALLKLGKRSGCEAFDGSGRVRLLPFLEWVFQRDESSIDWQARGKKFDALIKEVTYNRESGSVLGREEVETEIRACVAEMFSALDRHFLNELPSSLKGRTEIEIRDRCQSVISDLKVGLRSRFERLSKQQNKNQEPGKD